jgi:nitrite reductase/ring-hydroxylating ferredoxin subunit
MPERVPLPLPIGWYCVAEETELAAGEVRRLHYFGQELVLWRGEDGAPHVFDAYCPHLGAHLGVGGRVEGDGLRCPFHAWKFGADGRCTDIPYAKRIPPKAATRAWPIARRNGLIFAWYDPGQGEPRFELPGVPEWGDPAWTEPEVRSFDVGTHPQEMAENIVDAVHFRFVHGTPEIPPMEAKTEGLCFHATQALTFTTPQGESPGRVDVQMFGPGFGVTRFRGVVETLLLITLHRRDRADRDSDRALLPAGVLARGVFRPDPGDVEDGGVRLPDRDGERLSGHQHEPGHRGCRTGVHPQRGVLLGVPHRRQRAPGPDHHVLLP